jgi:diacylglycerol kinase
MRQTAPDRRPVLVQERSSFGYAFQGIRHAWTTQRHLRIHAVVTVLAVVLGLLLRISAGEWAVLLLTAGVVLAVEMINTVVEVVVDMITLEYHPGAKVAKDVAAGAVLLMAICAVGIGGCLFLPRLWVLVSP